jgi:hypothetical protein
MYLLNFKTLFFYIKIYSVFHLTGFITNMYLGRAMAQAVSRRPLTAEDRIHSLVSTCGICGGQGGTGAGFSPSSWDLLCHYHSTVALQTHISPGGGGVNNWPAGGDSSQTQSHPNDMNSV